MLSMQVATSLVLIWHVLLNFLYFFFCLDEENVEEETMKHRDHYFPSNNKDNPKRQRNNPVAVSNSLEQKNKNPVNYLFSNDADADSMDDDSNEDP